MTEENKTIDDILSPDNGITLNVKTIKALREMGLETEISPYYSDFVTNISREIEILSEYCQDVLLHPHNIIAGTLHTHLLIECKHIPTEILFWMDKRKIQQATALSAHNTGLSTETVRRSSHCFHYLRDEYVAKMFASKKKRESKEKELFFQAIDQVIKSLIYFRKNKQNLSRFSKSSTTPASFMPSFPLIVVDSYSKLYKSNIDDNTNNATVRKIDSPFQIEINYSHNSGGQERNEYFLIDVVSIDDLPNFFEKSIKPEVAKLQEEISQELVFNKKSKYLPYPEKI